MQKFSMKTFNILLGLASIVSISSLDTSLAASSKPKNSKGLLSVNANSQKAKGIKKQGHYTFRDRLFTGKVSQEISKGEKAFISGKYDEAYQIFWKEINKNSKDVAALSGLGFTLAVQFKLDGAEEKFDKALKVEPNYPLAHVGKAYVILNRLQTSSLTILRQKQSLLTFAEQECRKALSKDPTLPEALVVLGMVLKEQGRDVESQQYLSKAIDLDPKFATPYAQRGLIFLKQGNFVAAESDFKQAINFRSSYSTAHFGLGRVYFAQGKLNEALKELNTAEYLNNNSAPVHITLAEIYKLQGNVNAAINEYQKAILIKAENEQAYLGLSDIRENRGDLELALAELRSGIELNPASLELHKRVADIALKLEKTDDAIKEYQIALAYSPADLQAIKGMTRGYVLKAQKEANGAFFLSNNYEAAESMIQQAIRMNPQDMELRLADAKFRAMSGKTVDLQSLGSPTSDAERVAYIEALLAQYKYAEATDMMSIVMSHINDSRQLLALADISLLDRDVENAEMLYKKASNDQELSARAKRGLDAVSKARDNAQKELNFANDLARKNQLASSIDRYRNAAYLNPRLAEAHKGLAEALKKFLSKNPAALREAAQHFRAYLSLSPNLPEKERTKIEKQAEKCIEKAYKIERKQSYND